MERGMKEILACSILCTKQIVVLKKRGVLASLLPGGPFTCSQNKVFKLLILPF